MSAREIIRMLAERHTTDVFVTECKTGATQMDGANHMRLDAWAMKRSWANPVTWGYEVKVSRQDFLRDDKWHAYLNYCSDFYFVTPHGLIQPEELPPGVGLLWASKTGRRLFVKRKAQRRPTQIPEALYRYVLMSRCVIKGPGLSDIYDAPAAREYWEKWLENREVDAAFGMRVGKALGQRVKEEIFSVRKENDELRQKMAAYDGIRQTIRDMGYDPDRMSIGYIVRSNIKNTLAAVPPVLRIQLDQALDSLKRFSRKLDELEEESVELKEGAG